MIRFIIQAVVTMAGLWLSAQVVPGVDFTNNGSLVAAAIILGIVNAIVRPIMVVLTFPITVLTLGLFLLVNVMRKLGGEVRAGNREQGGAEVTIWLPLDAIAYPTGART